MSKNNEINCFICKELSVLLRIKTYARQSKFYYTSTRRNYLN